MVMNFFGSRNSAEHELGRVSGIVETLKEDVRRGLDSIDTKLDTLSRDVKEIEKKATAGQQLGESNGKAINSIEHELGALGGRLTTLEKSAAGQAPYWAVIKRYFPVIAVVILVASVIALSLIESFSNQIADTIQGALVQPPQKLERLR